APRCPGPRPRGPTRPPARRSLQSRWLACLKWLHRHNYFFKSIFVRVTTLTRPVSAAGRVRLGAPNFDGPIAPRPRPPQASGHAATGLVRGRAGDGRAGGGLLPDRPGGPALPRRRLLALVQRPRPPAPRHRRRGAQPARQGRPFDDARPLARGGRG